MTVLLSNEAHDARSAMCALIEARALPFSEDEAEYPARIAELAWQIADAMKRERISRQGGRR